MARVLRLLIVEPLRWAICEVWQWVLALGLLAGAWWVGHASGGRWWVALLLGAGLLGVFLLVAFWTGRLTSGGSEDEVDKDHSAAA